jgi:hypothetical protein
LIAGRVHGAVVSDIHPSTQSVTVEWFEKVRIGFLMLNIHFVRVKQKAKKLMLQV